MRRIITLALALAAAALPLAAQTTHCLHHKGDAVLAANTDNMFIEYEYFISSVPGDTILIETPRDEAVWAMLECNSDEDQPSFSPVDASENSLVVDSVQCTLWLLYVPINLANIIQSKGIGTPFPHPLTHRIIHEKLGSMTGGADARTLSENKVAFTRLAKGKNKAIALKINIIPQ